MFLIDTDVLSALRKRRRPPGLEAWIGGQRADDLFISVISVGEIERGVASAQVRDPEFAGALSSWLDRILDLYADRILPFGLRASRRWGQLSATLGNDSADLQIAATALEHGLAVATRNVRHFAPTGARVFNPFEPG